MERLRTIAYLRVATTENDFEKSRVSVLDLQKRKDLVRWHGLRNLLLD